jgi:hypothetical protein
MNFATGRSREHEGRYPVILKRVQRNVVNIPKEALIKSVTQSELPLIWGIYAPKVSIPLEGKVPTSSGGPDLRSPTLGDKGA